MDMQLDLPTKKCVEVQKKSQKTHWLVICSELNHARLGFRATQFWTIIWSKKWKLINKHGWILLSKKGMIGLNRQKNRCCQEMFQGVRIKTGHITYQGDWLHFAFPSIDQYWSGRAALSNWWVASLNKFQPEWISFCQGIPSLVVKIFHLPFGSMPPCSEMCCPTGSQACFSVGGNLSYVDPVSCLEA